MGIYNLKFQTRNMMKSILFLGNSLAYNYEQKLLDLPNFNNLLLSLHEFAEFKFEISFAIG